ncbi:MAG: MmgE/PrpD family protein, partial [Candidatus Limnocylindria bacterium]
AGLVAVRLQDVSARALEVAHLDLLDASGLCVAARNEPYVRALIDWLEPSATCTLLGHDMPADAAGAALVNGTAIHGEDFDDTLEGSPIRLAASVVPAVLAASERYGLTGEAALRGLIVGLETICRVNRVAPGAIHRNGFHPVSVLGVFGAAAGAAAALHLAAPQLTAALAIAGSMSSGTLAYLDDGNSWTKRLHPGWAAQAGYRAAILARSGFLGPTSLFDGAHNFFSAFAHGAPADLDSLLDGLGTEWLTERIAFKPYPCGTMIHPYVDCMIELGRRGVRAEEIASIEAETAAAIVDRLWEPLQHKRHPATGYAAKFSFPYCMAAGFVRGSLGLDAFTDEAAADPRVGRLADRISYVVDHATEYPDNYTGHIRVRLTDGSVVEPRRPHLRGGQREPLDEAELTAKFRANTRHGGWPDERSASLRDFCLLLETVRDMRALAAFRA